MTLVNQTRALDVDTVLLDQHEPGNGTRYDTIAIRINGSVQCGRLGRVTDGWLIVCGLKGTAYLFQDGDFVPDWYVEEKLGVHGADLKQVTRRIAELIGGTAGTE